jgi:hypothetical protein
VPPQGIFRQTIAALFLRADLAYLYKSYREKTLHGHAIRNHKQGESYDSPGTTGLKPCIDERWLIAAGRSPFTESRHNTFVDQQPDLHQIVGTNPNMTPGRAERKSSRRKYGAE